jgi:hypothetical protein
MIIGRNKDEWRAQMRDDIQKSGKRYKVNSYEIRERSVEDFVIR